MVNLSAKLVLLAGEPTHWCPGCGMMHRINVYAPNDHTDARWKWNGDPHKPTFTPSVHVVGYCHYFLTDGKLNFLSDCRHALAGKTVNLPDIPEGERD